MTIKNKFYAGVIITATLLVVLSGCHSSNSSSSSSGLKAGPGVDVTNKTITIGILSPYSGPVAQPIGIPLANGVKAYFDNVNDNGGVDGYKVKFLEEDRPDNPQLELHK